MCSLILLRRTKFKQMKANTQPKTFREIYLGLPKEPANNQRAIVKLKIVTQCEITNATFYNWLDGRNRIPGMAKRIITQIFKDHLNDDLEIEFTKAGKELKNV